jgi:uncharacterized protein involved in exopolysaccharide biosynthesis
MGFLSRITRRWRRILFVWLVVSVPVLCLIYNFVEPTFEAFSILRIEPVQRSLYETNKQEESRNVIPYLQTQVSLITCDRVLGDAMRSYEIIDLPVIKSFDDPKNNLRKAMLVEIVKDTYLIRIALGLSDGNQAASIVNSVVTSYLAYNSEFKRSGNSALRASLVAQSDRLQNEVKERQDELRGIYAKGTVDPVKRNVSLNSSKNEDDPTKPIFTSVTMDEGQMIVEAMVKADLETIKARSILEATQAAGQGETGQRSRQTLGELKANVAALVKEKECLAKYYERLKIDKTAVNNDVFEAAAVNYQLNILLDKAEQVKAHLQQLDFEATQETYHVQRVDRAAAPKAPTDNNRLRYMAAAPIVVILMLLGFFLLLPIGDEPIGMAAADRLAEASPSS